MKNLQEKFCLLLFVLLGIFFLIPSPAHSQQLWTGLLSPSRATNWSNAGATISTTRTQCATSACNTVSNGTSVTAASINAAIASMSSGQYLQIPAGTWPMSSGIYCNSGKNCSNLTIRGAGANSTFLVWSGSGGGSGDCAGHDVCFASTDTNYWGGPSNTATWTAGYASGSTSITLGTVSGSAPVVGQPIVLDQIDNQSDNGGLYVGCEIGGSSGGDSSPACYSLANPNGYERGNNSLSTIRGQQQIVTVTSISGSGKGPYTIGISPGIYAGNWNSAQSPGAWWATSPVYGDAVESLSLDHTSGGDGITFFNCQGCWVKGIRSLRGSATGTAWGHVTFSICNKCTVEQSYFWGYAGDTYGVSVDMASDSLIESNIFHYYAGSLAFYNSDCEGCVSDFNFTPGQFFAGSSNWQAGTIEFHGTVLFSEAEGNIGAQYYGDSFHGTHDLNTFFRNRLDGREQNNGTLTVSNTVPIILNPGDRYENIVGNVLGAWNGTNVFHKTYASTPTSFANYATSVYGLGIYPAVYSSSCTSDCLPFDTLSQSTTLRWGNYDVADNAVHWCGNSTDAGWSTTCKGASEVPSTLSSYGNQVPTYGDTSAGQSPMPPSLFYSAQPSWWPAGKAWPIIGPDVTTGNVGQCYGGTYSTMEVTTSQASQCTKAGGTFTALPTVVSNPAMDCYFDQMGGPISGGGSALSFTCTPPSSTTTTVPPPSGVNGAVIKN
jgi:hypothetical protein